MSHQKCKLRLSLVQSMHKTTIKMREVLNEELVLFKSGISHGQYAQNPGNKLVSSWTESSEDTVCRKCFDMHINLGLHLAILDSNINKSNKHELLCTNSVYYTAIGWNKHCESGI